MIGGELRIDDETLALEWFSVDNLLETLMPNHCERIEHAIQREGPYFKLSERKVGMSTNDNPTKNHYSD